MLLLWRATARFDCVCLGGTEKLCAMLTTQITTQKTEKAVIGQCWWSRSQARSVCLWRPAKVASREMSSYFIGATRDSDLTVDGYHS